jgi:hypothetical protein
VNDWSGLWLAIMAVSLLTMAVVQVGLILVVIRLARQVATMLDEMRREVRPIIDKLTRLTEDAQRATATVSAQVERLDEVFTTTAARINDIMGVVQTLFAGPVRQGAALLAVLRADSGAFQRRTPNRDRARRDEEDPLFVG